jgi:hypothetical protein
MHELLQIAKNQYVNIFHRKTIILSTQFKSPSPKNIFLLSVGRKCSVPIDAVIFLFVTHSSKPLLYKILLLFVAVS